MKSSWIHIVFQSTKIIKHNEVNLIGDQEKSGKFLCKIRSDLRIDIMNLATGHKKATTDQLDIIVVAEKGLNFIV
ncbi:MAG: hypothetical protein KDC56_03525 [Flavobacteriaceae bacterium]|nr:hypothetical protein [Flavobacteriaceae bacterium]